MSYIGPSITPLTGLNAGYRVYQIDTETFSVMGAQTYFANMSNSLRWTKPVWEFEYDTRQVYSVDENEIAPGPASERDEASSTKRHGIPWPSSSPLNATFWHLVTEKMLNSSSSLSTSSSSSTYLLDLYNTYETKSSSALEHRGPGDVSPEQKICFLRAGSAALGNACRQRFEGGGDARSPRDRAFGMI